MDAADAMEVTELIPAEPPALDADHANDKQAQVEPDETTNDVAMQQLSLEPAEMPLRTPSPTYHESPSTNPGSPLAPEDGVVEEEKEKETVDKVASSEPRAKENTLPQNAEQAAVDPPNVSTALTTTAAAEGNTGETNVDTEMEENTPAIPEPTETPNEPTTEAPSNELNTVNQAPNPVPTAMDQDPKDEAAKPDSSEPSATENTAPQNADQATLDPLLSLANAATALITTTAAERNTNETNIDTEMEEGAPAIPEPTETPNNPTTEAPSKEPTTVNQAPSPAPTAMDEGPKDEATKPESSEPSPTENAVPQNAEQATLYPPDASTALTTTAAAEGNTDETNVDTEMEENTPAIPEPTETPDNPTTEAPSSDPPTANNAASPAPAPMDEDPTDEAANPETSTNTNTSTSMALAKSVPPNVVDDGADNQGNPKAADIPDKGKGKGKDADAVGWGVTEPEKSSLGGAANANTNLGSWGPREVVTRTSGWSAAAAAAGGGGDTNTSSIQWETNDNNGNGNCNGNVMANGDSGFGGRTGGWGNRGRDRDSYGSRDRDRDRDSFRDKDGLRRARPASFGNGGGFGSSVPPFASGSNTELLPPLGRSPVKNLSSDRHARLARSAPYPPRREARSGDWDSAEVDYGSAGLDYGGAGGNDGWGGIRGGAGGGGGGAGGVNGTVILSQKPVVLNEMDLGGFDTLSKTMNNADIKAITKSLMDHIGQIQKWRNRNIDAHNLVRQCGHDYTERKAELQASLSVESDPQKKASIASKLEAHRLKGRAEDNLLQATVLSTETSMKREVEGLIHTVSEAMADKIHACILDVVKAVSTSGVGCDVEKVVERCVSIATPKLVRDQLGAQERLIRGLERRVGQLDDSLQERDKTIVDLNRRLKRLEGKVVNAAEGGHDLMITDTNDTSPAIYSTGTTTTDGDSNSTGAPDAQSQSFTSTNCVPQ